MYVDLQPVGKLGRLNSVIADSVLVSGLGVR